MDYTESYFYFLDYLLVESLKVQQMHLAAIHTSIAADQTRVSDK